MFKFEVNITDLPQEQIWKKILDLKDIKSQFKSPFRKDKIGKCSLAYYNNIYYFTDWADSSNHGIDLIEFCKRLDIDLNNFEEFKLENENKTNYKPSFYKESFKACTLNDLLFRDWEEEDFNYWKQFKIDFQNPYIQKIFENVKPTYGYTYENEIIPFKDLCFTYIIKQSFKIYFPTRIKHKFLGKVGNEDVWILNRNSNKLLICKSHKDLLCSIDYCEHDLININSETKGNMPIKSIIYLLTKFKFYTDVVILFDKDQAGLNSSNYLLNYIYDELKRLGNKEYLGKIRCVYIRTEGCKDTADVVENNNQKDAQCIMDQLLAVPKLI